MAQDTLVKAEQWQLEGGEKLKKNQTCVFDNFPQSGAVSVET